MNVSEGARRLDLSRRSGRLEHALYETEQETAIRQWYAVKKTLREIRATGESLEYGETLSALDTLLAIPLRKQRAKDRHELITTAEVFRNTFGANAGEVYRVWKSLQASQSTK
jgi:hypothetical protein